MYIDTTSRAAMESSISNYFDIPIDEIYQLIDYAAEKAQQEIIAKRRSALAESICVQHSRFLR